MKPADEKPIRLSDSTPVTFGAEGVGLEPAIAEQARRRGCVGPYPCGRGAGANGVDLPCDCEALAAEFGTGTYCIAIVYRCPSCDRVFDSPSVCSDGTVTAPEATRVTDEQARRLKHVAGFASGGSDGTSIHCGCGWISERLPDDAPEYELADVFASHVTTASARKEAPDA